MLTLLSKVWFDLWQDKTRTLQVTLVIALGAIGVGLVIGGRNLVAGAVSDNWQAAEPPNISLSVDPPLTKEQIGDLERIEGVAEVEGFYSTGVEWRLVGSEEWETGLLNGRDDYRNQKMTLDELSSGSWPSRNTAAIGVVSVGTAGAAEGDMVELRFGDTVRTFELVGTIDPVGPQPSFQEAFYVDGRTFARLTGRDTYNIVQTRDLVYEEERAIATDMESGTIAAQGFRLRVPYGALLCVSDKPLHGEIKMPGAANAFYETAIAQHLQIGLKALDFLKERRDTLHSRKLRSFDEPPFR
jgi:hypothetical protein